MEKIYVGQLQMAHRVSNADVTEKTELRFENGERRFEEPFKLRREYYVVEKSELDAYIARKEHLEQMNCTPVFGENQRLKAKIANLTEINKSLGEELRAENEKLKVEKGELKEKIKELGIIKSFLEVGNEKWIRHNTELESRNRDLELENAKLKGELAQAEYELASFNGEHTVEFLYEKHKDGKHIIGWTEVSGEEYELTFVTPESKIHA